MSGTSTYNPAAKHFINDPNHLVLTALRSITLANPSVALDAENKIIFRRGDAGLYKQSQVSVVSGGGAGHEPSFAAFVGPGILSGAISGTIFASPSAEQIRRCLLGRVDSAKGILVIVMNYTGDVLNFGMGVEKARATGVDIEMLVVGDDAGVPRSKGGKVGRRGIAGTVLVQKIAGALAATGAPLKDVHRVAKLASDNIVSIGSSLSHVHVPGRKVTEAGEDELTFEEVEIGMGIHNEAGSERTKADLPDLVEQMLAHMLDEEDKERGFLEVSSEDETVVLINNLGGVSVLEMGGIATEVLDQLKKYHNIRPVRVLVGTFMTSLNGIGFSISLLKLQDTALDKSMLQLLDAPSEVTGWATPVPTATWENKSTAADRRQTAMADGDKDKPSNLTLNTAESKKVLKAGLDRVIVAEPDVTHYDTIVGDGDCGIGLKRGAESVLQLIASDLDTQDAVIFMDRIISTIETSMDGTSGAIYAIFLNALAAGLRSQSPESGKKEVTTQVWAEAAKQALEGLGKYTPARPGDRTLVDALEPFIKQLVATGDLKKAAQAAKEGTDATKGMKASLGRSVYVGNEGFKEVPDPGAYGLSEFLTGLAEA
ncbi:dihydroxyacetone kinase [Aureobasidium pullulans]|uniref:Dihydroxyacetone kinase n=1 Tax=Aureobasidium pullulans TaxID=5580 RepID=A0A4S9TAU2_AURPU|nr:dihydroxyacetone kinase [Aureobasidium pullulans]THW66949.1 dihydroxyacetone kinase [Aureobasidium pullulans]THX76278.1 dihydroxyacetone kinase [Aureobasidium pullulans]THZ20947.1 dihydroxyacetone kinase [Aureobasidium pullulans]